MNVIVLHGVSMNGHLKFRKKLSRLQFQKFMTEHPSAVVAPMPRRLWPSDRRCDFVEPKSEEQQARAVLFRARQRLVHQRTDLVNALRAILYECAATSSRKAATT
ncbi:IS110 family transposase [Allomesorhizobium camelthorni]|uniref:IS110 family transposase n=1 Tax=Allomesorhizobium camelthorni TaxID=475069 RepID=A0A6G4WBF9_9HYPH|nr:IS110 family transposase [Mesorhizobium camelthorni]NGO52101.1 IS110 family transposase [Mesorhizobium camelthorni]